MKNTLSPYSKLGLESPYFNDEFEEDYEISDFEDEGDQSEIDEFDGDYEISANEFSLYEDNEYAKERNRNIESEEFQELEEAFAFGLAKLRDTWQKLKNSTVSPKSLPTVSPKGRPLLLPIVSSYLPDSKNYLKTKASPERYYGIPETIAALRWIGKEWIQQHPNVKFIIRDISQMGGGRISGHGSHRIGIDVDVKLQIDGKIIQAGTENYQFHREYVRDLITTVKKNPFLPIVVIGFQDRILNKEFGNLVKPWSGHASHLHLRFCMPAKRISNVDFKKVYPKGSKGTFKTCGDSRVNYVSSFPFPTAPRQEKKFNIQAAIKYNREKKYSLGWAKHLKIIHFNFGYRSSSPDDSQFAKAVARWQQENGFPEGDGKLGPNTWAKMKSVFAISNKSAAGTSTNSVGLINGISTDHLPLRKHSKGGYLGYGGGRVLDVLKSLKSQGKLSISDKDIEMLQRMSNVESSGQIQGINSFDNAYMSFGFLQWPILYNNKHGGKLQRLVKTVPQAFSKYGIELDHNREWKLRRGKYLYISIPFKGAQDPQELRSHEWAKRFYLAGVDPEIIIAEVLLALQVIKENKKKIERKVGNDFLIHYKNSNVLRALIQESFNHRPSWLYTALNRAIKKASKQNLTDTGQFLELTRNAIKSVWAEKGKPGSGQNMVTKTGRLLI